MKPCWFCINKVQHSENDCTNNANYNKNENYKETNYLNIKKRDKNNEAISIIGIDNFGLLMELMKKDTTVNRAMTLYYSDDVNVSFGKVLMIIINTLVNENRRIGE